VGLSLYAQYSLIKWIKGEKKMLDYMKTYIRRVFSQHQTVADVARLLAAEGHTEAATFLVTELKRQHPQEKYLHGLYGRVVAGTPERLQEEIKLIVETPPPPKPSL
jgi:hypothetical protein